MEKVTVKMIKAALEPIGTCIGVNCFQGEPTPSHHAVSIKKGTAKESIEALRAAGLTASHAYAFGPRSESLNVRRRIERGEQ